MKLDKSKPYGEIFGGQGRARYEQDGVFYDVSGNPIGAPAEVKPKKPVKKPGDTTG